MITPPVTTGKSSRPLQAPALDDSGEGRCRIRSRWGCQRPRLAGRADSLQVTRRAPSSAARGAGVRVQSCANLPCDDFREGPRFEPDDALPVRIPDAWGRQRPEVCRLDPLETPPSSRAPDRLPEQGHLADPAVHPVRIRDGQGRQRLETSRPDPFGTPPSSRAPDHPPELAHPTDPPDQPVRSRDGWGHHCPEMRRRDPLETPRSCCAPDRLPERVHPPQPANQPVRIRDG